MSIDNLMDELDELLEASWSLPLSGGKTFVDANRMQQILEEMRESLPNEIAQAKAIVADRSKIISDAKLEAETIVRVSEERSKVMVEESEIVKQAEIKANDILTKAQMQAKEIRKATDDYVDDLVKRTDDMLVSAVSELRKTKQSIRNSSK